MARECAILVALVARERRVPSSDLFSPARCNARIAAARQLAMYLCHVLLEMSMTDVGIFFGRDRTTVRHACARIEDLRDDGADEPTIAALEEEFARLRPVAREVVFHA